MNSSRKSLTLVLALVLAAAGCGSSPDPEAADGADGKSPLAPYLGDQTKLGSGGAMSVQIGADDQAPTEEELANQRKVEDAIAKCMQTAGFRYVPVQPEQQAKAKFDEVFKLPPDKFAAQYGYGISTIDWSKPGQDDTNPNTAIRNALSTAARTAYDKALHGQANSDGGVAVEKGKAPPTNLGCQGKAMEEVFGERLKRGPDDGGKYDSLFKDLEALQKRIEADPRVTAAAKVWSDCMADAGKTGLARPMDAPGQVTDKLSALTGQHGGDRTHPMRAPDFKNVDPQKLAQLRRFEIDLAKLDQSCRAKHYEAEYQKAQFELEQEFVDSHKAALEQFRDQRAQR